MTSPHPYHLTEVLALRGRGALFVVNHSGGKDSQAMTAVIRSLVPDDQIVVIHAHLGDLEWDGVIEHVPATTTGIEVVVCQRTDGKSLLTSVEERGMFPSPKFRQCTSDWKSGPVEKAIRGYLWDHPGFAGLIVSCMGMRAQESSNRSRLATFELNAETAKPGANGTTGCRSMACASMKSGARSRPRDRSRTMPIRWA